MVSGEVRTKTICDFDVTLLFIWWNHRFKLYYNRILTVISLWIRPYLVHIMTIMSFGVSLIYGNILNL